MMNSLIEKDFEDFIFEDDELLVIEKALFSFLDKYKDERIRRQLRMKEGTDDIIKSCIDKVKLHENFRKNSKFFEVKIKNYDEFGFERSSNKTNEKDADNKVA